MRLGMMTAMLSMVVLAQMTGATDVVPDLEQVQGMDKYNGPEPGKVLLKQNGFVVVPRYYHRIFSPYWDKSLAHYITIDSVHHTYHVIFEDLLKELETALASEMTILAGTMRAQFKEGTSSATEKARVFFAVADGLLSEKEESGQAGAELALIRAADRKAASPLFGYLIDYTQFKPRGFYTSTPVLRRYFQALSWFGNAAFRLVNPEETETACLIAKTLEGNVEAKAQWKKIDSTYKSLLGPCDDLTPEDYASTDIAGLDTLPDPRVNSMVLTPSEMKEWARLSKGMRFFGKRYIPDSEIFMNVTDPAVPNRGFPKGLDVLVANGSARARELMATLPDASLPGYAEGMARSEAVLDAIKHQKQPSHYGCFLNLLATITSPPIENGPAFTKTSAYADKNCMTALAAWANMRHAFLLHAKRSVICMGIDEKPPLQGYVEPNPQFFQAMGLLADHAETIFAPFDLVSMERLRKFRELVVMLGKMVDSELAGIAFTEQEVGILIDYSNVIGGLQGFDFNMQADKSFPWMGLVADVHSEMASGKCLEVATGAAMPIYVALEYGGKWQLLLGGVYSYYEFQQPLAERFTDEEWHKRLNGGHIPLPPPWTASYLASGYDVEALLERIRNGEIVEEILSIDTPAIDDFLLKSLEPDSKTRNAENLPWLFRTAAARLGRKAVPKLMQILRMDDPDAISKETPIGSSEQPESRPETDIHHLAARALGPLLAEEDLPALREMLLSEDDKRVGYVTDALRFANVKALEPLLLSVMREAKKLETRWNCLDVLAWVGSKDITPDLITLRETGEEALKWGALDALLRIWAPDPEVDWFGLTPLPSEADYRQLAAWEAEVRAIFLEFLRDAEPQRLKDARDALRKGIKTSDYLLNKLPAEMRIRLSDASRMLPIVEAAIRACGQLKITEAVPYFDKWEQEFHSLTIPEALVQIRTDKATERLLAPLNQEERIPQQGKLLELLKRTKSPQSVPVLRRLLSDTRSTYSGDKRVCDFAADALSAIYPKGPGFNWQESFPERDIQVLLWQDFLDHPTSEDFRSLSDAALARKILLTAQKAEHVGQVLPALSAFLDLRTLLAKAGASQGECADIEKGIVRLTAEEARFIAERLYASKEDLENYLANPEDAPFELEDIQVGDRFSLNVRGTLPDLLDTAMNRDPDGHLYEPSMSLSWKRYDAEGVYLDPWGTSYVVLYPGRANGSWVEVHSWGPNRTDEEGQGDDILIQAP